MKSHRKHLSGFTIVEVMMASIMLVVGLMGLIQAVTIGSEMLATARRQTLANQILDHQIEQLRFVDWSTISGYAAGPTTLTIDGQFRKVWSSTTAYVAGDLVSQSDVWYYCIANHTNKPLSNAVYWRSATATEIGVMSDTNRAFGATYALSRSVVNVTGTTNLREITFTLTWSMKPSGFSTARTYTRKKSGYFGKYGLNLFLQRS